MPKNTTKPKRVAFEGNGLMPGDKFCKVLIKSCKDQARLNRRAKRILFRRRCHQRLKRCLGIGK